MRAIVDDRVAFFLPALAGGGGGPGGAERITLNLAGEVASRGFRTDLVLCSTTPTDLPMIPDGVHVCDLRTPRVSRSFLALSQYLRRERPRALLSALDHGNVIALWARRLSRVQTRVVVANHIQLSVAIQHEPSLRGRLVPWFVRHSYGMADAVISVSHGAASDLASVAGIPLEHIHVIYNPVLSSRVFELAKDPVDHPWFDQKDVPVIISAGRLTRQKNFGLLLRAFAALRSRRRVRMVIFGEGEERPVLEKLVAELGIGTDVSLTGWTPRIYAYMARANLFVLSSLWEALPTVLIEAMALGIPIVSTDCRSGPGEILGGGKYGRLVPVGDSNLLAAAMESELSKPGPSAPREALRQFEVAYATEEYLKVLGLPTHA